MSCLVSQWSRLNFRFVSLYCILLLAALFTSSCHWEPISTHDIFSKYSTPSTPDQPEPLLRISNFTLKAASTPNQVSATYYNTSFDFPVPPYATLIDRCWCDFSSNRLFGVFNQSKWELDSLRRTLQVAHLAAQKQQVQQSATMLDAANPHPSTTDLLHSSSNTAEAPRTTPDETASAAVPIMNHWRVVDAVIKPFMFFLRRSVRRGKRLLEHLIPKPLVLGPPLLESSSPEQASSPVSEMGKQSQSNSLSQSEQTYVVHPKLPSPSRLHDLLLRPFDLSPYGIGLIVRIGSLET